MRVRTGAVVKSRRPVREQRGAPAESRCTNGSVCIAPDCFWVGELKMGFSVSTCGSVAWLRRSSEPSELQWVPKLAVTI